MFALKTTFSCSHSSGQRRRHLTNFLVNSTFMVAMLVKLLFLIVSSTSPATSFEGRFSRSKYALCFKRFSSIFVFLFSARLPIQLSWCEMETPFSDLLGLSAFLRLTEILLGVHYLFLGLPENISARHSQRVLEYGLLYNGLFTRFQWMIANQQRIACPPPPRGDKSWSVFNSWNEFYISVNEYVPPLDINTLPALLPTTENVNPALRSLREIARHQTFQGARTW